jgi:hypothetical protein
MPVEAGWNYGISVCFMPMTISKVFTHLVSVCYEWERKFLLTGKQSQSGVRQDGLGNLGLTPEDSVSISSPLEIVTPKVDF